MATVTLRGLRKRYGETRVLEGVDLAIADGEYLVLVGPSGCGKSTLLRCIAGLEEISEGDLSIGSRRVNDVSPRDRNVAMVFQSYALYPHMTVRENMAFALKVAKKSREAIEAAVAEAAGMLELGSLLDRYPAQLSGGQRQRVAMGRAIVRRPDVFLFDEPLSNLDAALRNHMRVELKRLHRRLGTTVVHVTHDQVEALTLADRILVLNKGVVQQVGTPRDLFDTPINTFVATFIGSPAMALIPAKGLGDRSVLDGVDAVLDVPGQGPFTLGVRPTDVRLGAGPLTATVDVVERLGAEALVHLRVGPHEVVAQAPEPVDLAVGAVVPIGFGRVHRFDRETGIRLLIWLLLAAAWADEVVVWHSWRGDEETALRQASDAWTAQTGNTVDLVAIPFGAFDSKVETAVPRGNGPDALIAGHGSIGKWSTMDVLVPWAGPEIPDLRPATQDAVRSEGTVWGVPLAYKSLVLFYDPARVREPPATTDDLIAAARTFTGDGSYGLAYQAAEPYFHAPWMHAFGAWAIDPDGGIHLDTEAHVRALAFTRRLALDEGIVPRQPTAQLVTRLYEDGKVAFVISGPWFLADVTRKVAAAPLPIVSETGMPARPYLTVDAAYVPAGSQHPALAADLIAFLAGPEGARIRQEVGHQAVSNSSLTSDDPLLRVLAAQAETAVPMPTDPRAGAVWEAEARALRRVLRGAASPEKAAIEAQAYEQILDQPRPEPADPRPYVALAALVGVGLLGAGVRPFLDPALRARIRTHASDYLWVVPAGFAMLLLVVLPFVTGATVSLFAHWRGEWTFVGFRQFADILFSTDFPITSPMSFWFTLAVTVLWTVTNVALHVVIGVALALLLREPWIRLRSVWRALLIIPWAIPNYITALVWKGMFHAQYGAINAVLSAVLGHPVELDWFGSFSTAFAANLATNTWLGFPFMMVVTLGALQAIPRDLEEAAEVDGAGWWLRFRHVTWPLLRPALLPAVILGSVWTFNLFNVVYLVSGGEPDGSTEILISEAYRWAFSRGNRYGYAAAYAVIIFGVLLLYARGANKLVGRRVL